MSVTMHRNGYNELAEIITYSGKGGNKGIFYGVLWDFY